MNNEPSDATKPVAWGHPAILLATCFWIGRLRPAPGTWGSAAALPFIAALSLAEVPFFIEVQLWLTLCCIGVPICTIASKQLGGQKDPSSIILDEFAAMPLVLLVVPAQQRTLSLIHI